SERGLVILAGLAVSLLLVFLHVIQPRFLGFIDHKIYDQLLLETNEPVTSGRVVIVDIDEKSLAEFGQWPWPRFRVAKLLGEIKYGGALSVGLDILFAEPDRTSPEIIKQQIKQDLNLDVHFKGWPDILMNNDDILAMTLEKGPYVLGYTFAARDLSDATRRNRPECFIKPLQYSKIQEPGAEAPLACLPHYDAADCPLPVLAKAAPAAGFFSIRPDPDGVIRTVALLAGYQGEIYPNLSLAALLQALGGKSTILKTTANKLESMKIGPTEIPLDGYGKMYINYQGPAGYYPYVSAADVLARRVSEETFKNKIVLIGTSASGLKDIRTTPFSSVYPGVEAHATIIDNILTRQFIKRPFWAPGLERVATFAFGLAITLLLAWAKAGWMLVPVVLASFGVWEASAYALGDLGVWVSPLYPLLTLGLNFALLTLLKFYHEESQKKFLHATFASYLSPELIDKMFAAKKMPELGGEARTITAYFTDIQGFSSFSEKLTAHQLVELLNEYLSAMTDILIGNNGTLDKYEGDAIIAFFGAPMDLPDHALRACRVAVAMQAKNKELREKWSREKQGPDEPDRNVKSFPPDVWVPGDKWPLIVHNMLTRIGINSGEIVVGNMGSSMRMNYTMMGDAVNLAARLEEGAKQYGVYTMVSEFTMDQPCTDEKGQPASVREMVEARFLDNIQVVGKQEPVKVYELCAMKGGLSDQETRLFELFNAGMERYLATDWDAAIALFEQALPLEPAPGGKTTPSEVFIQRCREFKQNPPVPPGKPWDGVYRMTKK
ncbi:MAG: CHASE2 domain-containing protein, partial [Desulfovibrionaceae bacterium]